MTNNLELWDKVRRVPEEHLKGFKRGGGFSGTAIKPMWSIHKMTEVFGPCGQGWGIDKPDFQVVAAGNETLVFCTVRVWHGSTGQPNFVYGVGGDKVLAVFSSGPKPDDEAFKKAYTDAVTNALKLIGVGADIHMGLWDGNKYVDEPKDDKPSTRKPLETVTGDKAETKANSRAVYQAISDGIRKIAKEGTNDDLNRWYKSKASEIEKLPADWHQQIMQEFTDTKQELKEKEAA